MAVTAVGSPSRAPTPTASHLDAPSRTPRPASPPTTAAPGSSMRVRAQASRERMQRLCEAARCWGGGESEQVCRTSASMPRGTRGPGRAGVRAAAAVPWGVAGPPLPAPPHWRGGCRPEGAGPNVGLCRPLAAPSGTAGSAAPAPPPGARPTSCRRGRNPAASRCQAQSSPPLHSLGLPTRFERTAAFSSISQRLLEGRWQAGLAAEGQPSVKKPAICEPAKRDLANREWSSPHQDETSQSQVWTVR